MDGTEVLNPGADQVLDSLVSGLDGLSPEIRKAANYVIENKTEIGISSIREMALAAGVKPNTLVRLARVAGFDGYGDFRKPFRAEIRRGTDSFPDRARWLQSLKRTGRLGGLYADMANAALRNIEETFAGVDEAGLTAAARTIRRSRETLVFGIGVHYFNACNFTYLAGTGMDGFHAIPRPGSNHVDDLARADARDALLAMTCKPYRREVVEATRMARSQGLKIIGISDSPASPVVAVADHGFVVSADSPQFFPSSVPVVALLETLLSFVIAVARPDVVARVEDFHARRHALGIYHEAGQ